MNQPLTDQQLDQIDAVVRNADLLGADIDPATATVLLAEVHRLRAELDAAVSVSESLYRRLSQEQLAGSALYAALTMPTTPQQRQAALDQFTAVAQQVHGSAAAASVAAVSSAAEDGDQP